MNWIFQLKMFAKGFFTCFFAVLPLVTMAFLLALIGIRLGTYDFVVNLVSPLLIYLLAFIYLVGRTSSWWNNLLKD